MKMLLVILLAITSDSLTLWSQPAFRPAIPTTWDEAALADWGTPLAGLNARPTHMSAKEYYSMEVDNLRTYPVYFPGHEPEGYWEMLQRIGPKPLIEPEKLKIEADWIEAGRRIFEELDVLQMRTFDPKLIAAARSREGFPEAPEGRPWQQWTPPDGIATDLRWVPTKQGVALSLLNCSECHMMHRPNGTRIPGPPGLPGPAASPLIPRMALASGTFAGTFPFAMLREPFGPEFYGKWAYQGFAVPWIKDDINERLKTLTQAEVFALNRPTLRGGGFLRWNGSLYYPSKIPDLIGIKERKYIDHTATHLHRGIGDLMRYAALVSFAETVDFGRYHVIDKSTKRIQVRIPDEALYALALYIYSLKPPPNPNAFDEKTQAGQKIFAREGCIGCHVPPLYTSNKLTLAQGFDPPKDTPPALDILRISVGTDPGLALKTRKGTGYYKVPSLKGVWYRGHYLHDGSAASLEEMFDPDRLKETHVPGGYVPTGEKTHAIQGHEFGLKLLPAEREQLLAFLRTL